MVSEVMRRQLPGGHPAGDLDTAGVPDLGVGDQPELVVRAENTAVGLDAPRETSRQGRRGSEAAVRSAAFDGSINTYVLTPRWAPKAVLTA